MKKKIIIFLIIVSAAFYFVFGNPVVFFNNRSLKSEILKLQDNSVVSLNDVVPFEWDMLYTFSPYTSEKEIEEIIGFKSGSITQTVSEGQTHLIFVKGKKIVASICGYPGSVGYNIYWKDYTLQQDNNLEFLVEYKNDTIYLTSIS